MAFNFSKIDKTFNVRTIVAALDYNPLVMIEPPYEEKYTFWQLFYVAKGHLSVLRNGKTELVSAGQIVFRPPSQKSTMLYPSDYELCLGILDFICDDEAMHYFGTGAIDLDSKEQSTLSHLIKEANEFYKSDNISLWPELISTGLENFLLRLYGRMNGIFSPQTEDGKINKRNGVSKTVDRINVLLEERRFTNISIDEIATIFNESPNVLMKRYKKEMHQSIMDHFLELKLQTAIHLILTSDMNFTEISELLGFSSVNYFSKFFKKRMGMTLTEYSKNKS